MYLSLIPLVTLDALTSGMRKKISLKKIQALYLTFNIFHSYKCSYLAVKCHMQNFWQGFFMIFLLTYVTVYIFSVQVSSGHCWSYNPAKVNYAVTSARYLNRRMLISAGIIKIICHCCCCFSGKAGTYSNSAGTMTDTLVHLSFHWARVFLLSPLSANV